MEQAKCPHAPRECPPINIDPRGDLWLKVGLTACIESDSQSIATDEDTLATETTDESAGTKVLSWKAIEDAENTHEKHDHVLAITFRVCSRTLARSSPVWEKMLYGRFAESKPSGSDWVVELPDDDAEAIELLLYIAHARLDSVPAFDHTPEVEKLYQIAVFADKWDMIQFLRPWANTWAGSIGSKIKKGADRRTLARYLWISWTLGAKTELIRAARRFAMRYRDEENELEDLFSDILEPPGLIRKDLPAPPLPKETQLELTTCIPLEMIKQIRLELIWHLLAP